MELKDDPYSLAYKAWLADLEIDGSVAAFRAFHNDPTNTTPHNYCNFCHS